MIALPATIRLFPLGEVVLFPGTRLPLHVFELRYRRMLADALADDCVIGMVLVRGAAGPISPAPPDDLDHPEVYAVGCAGRIVEHHQLDDGGSTIVLEGSARFRIKREVDNELPYRIAEAQALYEAPVLADLMRSWRDQLRGLMTEYVALFSNDLGVVEKIFAKLDVEGLVNYLCATVSFEAVEKQSLLECPTLEQRFGRLCDMIAFKIAEAKLGLLPRRGVDS